MTMPDELTVGRTRYVLRNGEWRQVMHSDSVTTAVSDAVAALLDHLAEEQDEEDE